MREKPNEEEKKKLLIIFLVFLIIAMVLLMIIKWNKFLIVIEHPKFIMGKINEAQVFYLNLKNLKCCSNYIYESILI